MQKLIKIIVLLALIAAIEIKAKPSNEESNEIEPELEPEPEVERGLKSESEYNVNAHRMPLGRCVSGLDCEQRTECSVMGMQRFSEPRCEPLGGLGSPCRMFSEPENKTLSFPNIILTCERVYMQFCPCDSNLVCQEGECKAKVVPIRGNSDELRRRRERLANRWARLYNNHY